eukprot:TRINITY_DN3812_c0_g1_i6.p2 TRINITY_DN3812_c0_g1~~TRINITY_DN3812_c0_g1_i6.p2  ORF type:complete len:398 (-),score=63.86 TRINITY_DN3812_c0_g1_i6:597-1790(-)
MVIFFQNFFFNTGFFFFFFFFFFFKQKTAYEMQRGLVGSEMCIRDRYQRRVHGERELVEKLKFSFLNSEKLQKHVSFLFAKGSMYLKYNSNLLYHGCIPLNEDGSFKKVSIGASGKEYSGKSYLDRLEILVREGYLYKNNPEAKLYGMDIIWYLWNGIDSPLFGKDKMTTFERYFIEDKETHVEKKNYYFKLENDDKVCNMIFEEFGLDSKQSHIINGHVPVKIKKGETPIKAKGKLIVIDGGFSRAYQDKTGIAGYTLIYNSYGLLLVSHEPFESAQKAIEYEKDILSTTIILEQEVERKRVGDTDVGSELKVQIEDLELLLDAYRKGIIKEQRQGRKKQQLVCPAEFDCALYQYKICSTFLVYYFLFICLTKDIVNFYCKNIQKILYFYKNMLKQ